MIVWRGSKTLQASFTQPSEKKIRLCNFHFKNTTTDTFLCNSQQGQRDVNNFGWDKPMSQVGTICFFSWNRVFACEKHWWGQSPYTFLLSMVHQPFPSHTIRKFKTMAGQNTAHIFAFSNSVFRVQIQCLLKVSQF